jgi:superfamily II DNA or RNA helicase
MSETNPLVENLKSTLHRYITTTLPISRRYPSLQERVRELVAQQPLVKGPYIEGLPDFEKGLPLQDLCTGNGGFLHDGLQQLPKIILQRKLHLHQEKALTSACKDNRSIIVATGTGSGKTECFLYPLAHHLLNDSNPTEPGVRVLLIYPMNALANDQLYYRIAPLLGRYLRAANITFGRYTSQIKANVSRAEEIARIQENSKLMDALGGSVPENWLLTREEMLNNPPQVLVTNYAMLEHLLLLPRNAPLFQENKLRSIVLDEIHTYAGAQATEVAYLLRKLKNRLASDVPLQVFGTSASLSDGVGADEQLIDFAGKLFGEEVHEVIRGKRIPHARLQEPADTFSLTPQEWISIAALLDLSVEEEFGVDDWNDEFADLGLDKIFPKLDTTKDLQAALEQAFYANQEIRRVAQLLGDAGIVRFVDVAKGTFNDPSLSAQERTDALNAVMHLGMTARSSGNAFPLLPSRYHIATNSIEGISVCLDSTTEGWSGLQPHRKYNDEQKRPYYSLLVCRRCGQPYIEAFSDGEYLFNLRKENSVDGRMARKVFWLGTPAQYQVRDEDDEMIPPPESEEKGEQKVSINPLTGKIVSAEHDSGECVTLYEVETVTDELEKNDYVKTCKACGSRANGAMAEIVTSMQAGDEALGAVVTQQVLEALPPEADRDEEKPMQGRSLLTFSDNRQNAAFFAPYFERTASKLALRTAIYQVLHVQDEPVGFTDMAPLILKHWKKNGDPVVFDGDGRVIELRTLKLEQLTGITAVEFCTPGGRRNSLEALGLVQITLEKRKLRKLVREVEQTLPEQYKDQTSALLHILLETIRREKAITNLADVDMRDPNLWGEVYSNHRSFELYKTNPKVTNGWIPQEGRNSHNRRTWYLVERLGMSWDEARTLLGHVWEIFRDQNIVLTTRPGFCLDSSLLRLVNSENASLQYCEDCGLLQLHTVDGRCTAFRCQGVVKTMKEEERIRLHSANHYINSFKHGAASTVRAREHTASLSTDVREKIEQEFSERKINLLSCTTTMEMGVDLGDLEAIICLNIPPGISNYQQRTGRAGRRAQAAPFCVTVARNSQYDQSVFRSFKDYLEQPPPVPRVHLDNAKLFNRHQNSIVLSGFLRHRIKNLQVNAPSLADFFGATFGEKDRAQFMEAVHHWLESEEGKHYLGEAERLENRLPDQLVGKIALYGLGLKSKFIEHMNVFAEIVQGRWAIYETKKNEYLDAREISRAGHWESLQKKYMNQFLVNQLSLQGLIPTYSFPVNSLTLDVTREYNHGGNFPGQAEVSLARDAMLGISEYAPGAEVIANGRVWTSAGLAYYPRDFMPTRYYVACPECHHVEIREESNDLGGSCGFCGNTSLGRVRSFIEPRGFVTSYKERKGKDPAQHRVRKQYADEAKLISIARENQYGQTDHPSVSKALLRSHASDLDEPVGKLFVVNRGRYKNGFHHCSWCNYMEPARKLERKDVEHYELLGNKKCLNKSLSWPMDIAHVFSTDVCIFRFNTQLPLPQKTMANAIELQRYFDSFSRTLNEALRFGAVDAMGLQPDVIRSAHKFGQGYLSTIL